jgi:hypothetical protein
MLILDSFLVKEAERALCAEAIRCGDLHQAAKLLGISPMALQRRMARYGLLLPQQGSQAMMSGAAIAFAAAFLREVANIGLDVSTFPSHRLAYVEVASWARFVHPTIPGCEDIVRGLVASVHAQGLDAFDVQHLADAIERRSASAIEYVDAVRWSVMKAEEAAIRARLRNIRPNTGWEQLHARLRRVDPRLARRLRMRHSFLRDMRAETGPCEPDALHRASGQAREGAP